MASPQFPICFNQVNTQLLSSYSNCFHCVLLSNLEEFYLLNLIEISLELLDIICWEFNMKLITTKYKSTTNFAFLYAQWCKIGTNQSQRCFIKARTSVLFLVIRINTNHWAFSHYVSAAILTPHCYANTLFFYSVNHNGSKFFEWKRTCMTFLWLP